MDKITAVETDLRQRTYTDWQTEFWPAFLLSLITCGIYGLYVLYKLLERRQQHFERMITFRYHLIQLIKEKVEASGRTEEFAAQISQLEGLHVQMSNRDRDGEKSPVLWLVLMLVANVVEFYIFYFLNDDFRAHEASEQLFMRQAGDTMQRLGMTDQPIMTTLTVPERNFTTFLILTLVTCGFYFIYWWYTVIIDGNSHFDNHATWESQLFAFISTQGEAIAQQPAQLPANETGMNAGMSGTSMPGITLDTAGAPGPGTPGPDMPGGGMPGSPTDSAGASDSQRPVPGAPGGGMPVAGMPPGPAPADKASGVALAATILSILGLLCCGLTSIVGIILGVIELGRIKKGESSSKGRGLAMAGIIIGAIVIGLYVLVTIISIATGNYYFHIGT
ncbi:MAG: DUF4190 domain-containing protein [Chloroflexi bacterium]|nr:DUF4190 domain-containing protein [Chloroflexota bacterium]